MNYLFEGKQDMKKLIFSIFIMSFLFWREAGDRTKLEALPCPAVILCDEIITPNTSDFLAKLK
jgi:hypothetical protein